MKTHLLFLFLLLLSVSARAGQPNYAPTYFLGYEPDTLLKSGEARLTVISNQYVLGGNSSMILQFGVNGSSEVAYLRPGNQFTRIYSPGRFIFQFYCDENYYEITTDSIELRAGENAILTLNFQPAVRQETALKPVIYLYPETTANVSVEVKPAGNFTFTYPFYDGGWKTTAHPNGDLLIDGKIYPYLFWEADYTVKDPFAEPDGFVVRKENVIDFLEDKLSNLGLNAKEQTDFITFWGPRLAANDCCLVRFLINDECDFIAGLNISPKPDRLNRVYILWTPVENNFTKQLNNQVLPVLNRDGFDVLEWGGSQIESSSTEL